MSFGSRLKERREELKWKQSELGQKLGITGSAVANYENGINFPKEEILYKIFDVFHCDANYFFQDTLNKLGIIDRSCEENKEIPAPRQEQKTKITQNMTENQMQFLAWLITTATDKCNSLEEVKKLNEEIRKHSAEIMA